MLLAEIGKLSAAFLDPRRGRIDVACAFEAPYWPGREVYAGHKLRYRLGLYEDTLSERKRHFVCRIPARMSAVRVHPLLVQLRHLRPGPVCCPFGEYDP
jgi:hypothetical protein